MRKEAIYSSVGLHVVVIILTMVSLPWLKKDFVIPPPISIEFVDNIDKITQTNKQSQVPAPKKEEKKPEEAPKPPPAPTNKSSEPKPPEKAPEKPDDKKEEKKEVVDKDAIPDKKKPPEKKKEEKKEKPEPKKSQSFDSLLKNLAEPKKDAPAPAKLPDMKLNEATPAEGQNAPLGEKLTMSEEDALRAQLEKCWSVPMGAKDAQNLQVQIFMVINRDRTLQRAEVVDKSRYSSDPVFRAAADSALRAVQNPLCSPFQVPPDKYDVWKTTTVNFDPSQML